MKRNSAFTIVELLVVITILAIISVVAYTQFGWITDKAKNSSKLDHLTSIEWGLNMFQTQNNYYPMPSAYSATNVWGYSGAVAAAINNTIAIVKPADVINSFTSGSGGGIVYESGSIVNKIGAKWVIDATVLDKTFLSQELYDPAIKDITVGNDKYLKDYGVGKYVYGVYAKNNVDWTKTSKKWSAFNLAATLSDDQKGYITKITGTFAASTCINCPETLIGSGTANINLKPEESTIISSYTGSNNRTAYPISF